MSFSKSYSPRRVLGLLAILAVACAGSGDGAASPDADEVDCASLSGCDDQLRCSGGEPCFKLKSCPGFVCASTKLACRAECGQGADCLLLESQPMMMGCR